MLETEKLDDLFPLLDEMTQSTIGDPKLAPRLLIIMWGLQWCCWIGLPLTYLALLWLRYGTTPPGFPDAQLVFLGIFLVLFFVFLPIAAIARFFCDRWPPKQFVPYMKLSRENAVRRDAELITRLLTFDKATLVYGLLQYRHRWSSLEYRFAAFVGDLRKLGLIPALVALLISVATFKEDSNQFLWVGLVVIVVVFNLVAFAVFLFSQRTQQVIQLLEYAIQHADQCNTTPSDANH